MTHTEPLLKMRDICKAFSGVLALDNARLTVEQGECHALIGQNGAGKSTLIKILTGADRCDRGYIIFDNHAAEFSSPYKAQLHGISTIYQEINLVPYRSVAENIFMGREPRKYGLLDWKLMHLETAQILDNMGIKQVDPRRPLNEYNTSIQQMVAIARAISFNSKLVVMDEPTSSLSEQEVNTLFDIIQRLKSNNISIIFVSHRLEELYAVCDSVTIMRDGQTVAETSMKEISKLELIAKMLGKDLSVVSEDAKTSFHSRTIRHDLPPLLEIDQLTRGRALQGVSLTVHPGEIVGLAGLLGSGRTEVARAIFGADQLDSGSITFGKKRVKFSSPADAIAAGIGFCSEDRKTQGIIPDLSVRENLTLAALPLLSKNGIVSKTQQNEIVDKFISRMGIKVSNADQKITELSGGNQQKVLLARWLCLNPRLLILDEPTRGIDVGAKGEIQMLIDDLADNGLGVLMISSELEELVEGSERVVVMHDGSSIATLEKPGISQDVIMRTIADGTNTGTSGN